MPTCQQSDECHESGSALTDAQLTMRLVQRSGGSERLALPTGAAFVGLLLPLVLSGGVSDDR